MSRLKDTAMESADIVVLQQQTEVTVLPPDNGFLGRFLEETENMLKARAMRMSGLLRRINESGQQTEVLLRMAADRMEAAQARIEKDLRKEGLLPETQGE